MKKTDAISYFGSATAVAKALQIGRSAVSQWREIIPLRSAILLNHLTGIPIVWEAYAKEKKEKTISQEDPVN